MYSYFKDSTLVSIRREEAKNAAEVIGINNLIFLEEEDSKLSASHETVNDLRKIFLDIKPGAVFLPSFMDNHIDRLSTNRIFLSLIL